MNERQILVCGHSRPKSISTEMIPMLAVNPDRLRNNTSDGTRNILQIVEGTEDGRSTTIVWEQWGYHCWLSGVCDGLQGPPLLPDPSPTVKQTKLFPVGVWLLRSYDTFLSSMKDAKGRVPPSPTSDDWNLTRVTLHPNPSTPFMKGSRNHLQTVRRETDS